MSDSSGAGFAVALGCAPLMILGLLLMVPVLMTDEGTSCSPGGPGVTIDTDDLPDGAVAGYSGEQLLNAAYIINAGAALDLSAQEQTIGVMTAMGESSLRVLDEGDAAGPDSRGLFQQRDNGAWGSYEDRMDPTISATSFFRELMTIDQEQAMGGEILIERRMSLIAHAVQINADPYHYAPYWESAEMVFEALSGVEATEVGGARSCAVIGGGDPQLSQECGPVAHPNLQATTCQGYAAIQAEFGIDWPGGVGCWASRPPGTPQDHPNGLACDYMVATSDTGRFPTQEMHAQAIEVINWLIQHHEALDINYIIYEGHIWNVDRNDPVGLWPDVKRYSSAYDRGDPTIDHYDHIHVTHYP